MTRPAQCPDPPVVYILPEAKAFLDLYITLCPEEISGLGEVRKFGNDFLVERIHLMEQEVTSASTNLDQGDVANFLVSAVRRGIDTERIKIWWHSHVHGNCYWSTVDDATMERFQNGWMIAIVGNKRGEYRARVDLYEPIRITIDDLPIEIFNAVDRGLVDPVKEEIRKKVSVRPYKGWLGNTAGYLLKPTAAGETFR